MLGKLFVSEIKQTYKPMIITIAILVGSTLVSNLETSAYLNSNISRDNIFILIIGTLLGLVFTGSMIALAVAGFIFLNANFYKSMFSKRGYLTHTLPVKTGAIFNVKIIVATLWMFISSILIIFCFLLRAVNLTEETFGEFFNRISGYIQIRNIDFSEFIFVGKSTAGTIAILLTLGLFGIIDLFLFFFTTMTFGQLSSEHKTMFSICAGIGLYILRQVIRWLIMLVLFDGGVEEIVATADIVPIINKGFTVAIIFSVLLMIVEYIVDMRIVNKHLNLQ